MGGAEEGLDPVVVDMDPQAFADQLRGRAVEDLVDEEAPGLRDPRDHLGEVRRAPRRQRFERRHLDARRGFPPPVATGDQLIDEAAPVGELGEVAGPRRIRA
jgi:hypothetical protein